MNSKCFTEFKPISIYKMFIIILSRRGFNSFLKYLTKYKGGGANLGRGSFHSKIVENEIILILVVFVVVDTLISHIQYHRDETCEQARLVGSFSLHLLGAHKGFHLYLFQVFQRACCTRSSGIGLRSWPQKKPRCLSLSWMRKR